MKAYQDPFPKKGSNMHDQTGRTAVCVHCKTPIPPKAGFRPAMLKCPKCGAKGA